MWTTRPLSAGPRATDPVYRRLSRLIKAFRDTGFDGLINFPTVGDKFEESKRRAHVGQGFQQEVEMVRLAREADYLTMAYVWNAEQARAMAAAGVDINVPHVGWTVGGLSGAGELAKSIERGCEETQKMIKATWDENKEVICLSHGGPFASPEDTRALYEQTDAQGFVGASSIERIPIERGGDCGCKGVQRGANSVPPQFCELPPHLEGRKRLANGMHNAGATPVISYHNIVGVAPASRK